MCSSYDLILGQTFFKVFTIISKTCLLESVPTLEGDLTDCQFPEGKIEGGCSHQAHADFSLSSEMVSWKFSEEMGMPENMWCVCFAPMARPRHSRSQEARAEQDARGSAVARRSFAKGKNPPGGRGAPAMQLYAIAGGGRTL